MAYLNARSWRKAGVRSFGSGSRASWDHTAHRDCHDMAQEQKRCLQYEHMIPCLAVDCLEPRHPRMANWVHLRLLHLHQRVPLRGNAITAQHPYICATHRLLSTTIHCWNMHQNKWINFWPGLARGSIFRIHRTFHRGWSLQQSVRRIEKTKLIEAGLWKSSLQGHMGPHRCRGQLLVVQLRRSFTQKLEHRTALNPIRLWYTDMCLNMMRASFLVQQRTISVVMVAFDAIYIHILVEHHCMIKDGILGCPLASWASLCTPPAWPCRYWTLPQPPDAFQGPWEALSRCQQHIQLKHTAQLL